MRVRVRARARRFCIATVRFFGGETARKVAWREGGREGRGKGKRSVFFLLIGFASCQNEIHDMKQNTTLTTNSDDTAYLPAPHSW